MSIVPTPTTTLTLDEINPASFDFWMRDDVHGAFAKLRRERPVAWHQHPDSGKGFWSLTRFDDVAAATRDWQTFSSAFGIQAMMDPEDSQRLAAIRSMISTDPPRHTKLRAVVNRGFTPKMVARAEESVRRRAREIVDAIAPEGRDRVRRGGVLGAAGGHHLRHDGRARARPAPPARSHQPPPGGRRRRVRRHQGFPAAGRGRAPRLRALARPEAPRASGERPDEHPRPRRGGRRGHAA